MILVLLLTALLASTFTIGNQVLHYVKPFFLVGIRLSIAGAAILSYLSIFELHKLIVKSKRGLLLIFNYAILYLYLMFITEYWAL